jgi:hypothetical protein
MRHARNAFLAVLLIGCSSLEEEAPPSIMTDIQPTPFKAGGPFTIGVTGYVADLGPTSHATVEIVTPSAAPPGAVRSATITLNDQDDGTVAGTANLAWPPGGPVPVRVEVAGQSVHHVMPLELPKVYICPADSLENTGTQLLLSACIQSTSSDGVVNLRMTGGTFADTGATEKTATLTLGVCGACVSKAIYPSTESSYTTVRVAVNQSGATLVASMPSTAAVDRHLVEAPPPGLVEVCLSTAPSDPGPLDIVALSALVTIDGRATPGIIVSFHTLPTSDILPAAALTDSEGRATARVVRPAEGELFIEARVGNARDATTL